MRKDFYSLPLAYTSCSVVYAQNMLVKKKRKTDLSADHNQKAFCCSYLKLWLIQKQAEHLQQLAVICCDMIHCHPVNITSQSIECCNSYSTICLCLEGGKKKATESLQNHPSINMSSNLRVLILLLNHSENIKCISHMSTFNVFAPAKVVLSQSENIISFRCWKSGWSTHRP